MEIEHKSVLILIIAFIAILVYLNWDCIIDLFKKDNFGTKEQAQSIINKTNNMFPDTTFKEFHNKTGEDQVVYYNLNKMHNNGNVDAEKLAEYL